MAESYDELKKAELVELAESRGIDSSGTKADIIERLSAADAADDATPDDDLGDIDIDAPIDADLPVLDADDPDDDPEDASDPVDADTDVTVGEVEAAVAGSGSARPGATPVASHAFGGHAAAERLADVGRRPNDRGAKPWDALKEGTLTMLREQTADLWQDGQEQLEALGGIAEDMAREKWRSMNGSPQERRRANTNLKHLDAQLASRTAMVKMHLVEGGDSIFLKVLQTALKTLVTAGIGALI